MAFTIVNQSYITNSGPSITTLDTTAALNVQAGDLLFFVGNFNANVTVSFAETGGANSATVAAITGGASSGYLQCGYKLVATSNASALFRATFTSAVTYAWFAVLQYRPSAGNIAALDAGPSPATGSSYATTSGLISTTAPGVIISALNHGLPATNSDPLIAGAAANLYPSSGSIFYAAMDYLSATSQTNVTASLVMAPSRTWVMDIFAFKEVASSVNQTITCTGITLGGTSTNQEVFVGGIG